MAPDAFRDTSYTSSRDLRRQPANGFQRGSRGTRCAGRGTALGGGPAPGPGPGQLSACVSVRGPARLGRIVYEVSREELFEHVEVSTALPFFGVTADDR